jgi:hypothetical protein
VCQSSQAGRLTRPNSGILCEEIAIVLPLGGVAVDGPALAQLRDGEAVEELLAGTVNVRVALGMGIRGRGHGEVVTTETAEEWIKMRELVGLATGGSRVVICGGENIG